MGQLISENGMQVAEISKNEVLLRSSDYVLNIFADRDGVNVVYFDTDSRPHWGYNVFLFLYNKRRDSLVLPQTSFQPKDYSEFIEAELGALSNHLRTAGQDILRGSKDWIKSYSWPVVRASADVAAIL